MRYIYRVLNKMISRIKKIFSLPVVMDELALNAKIESEKIDVLLSETIAQSSKIEEQSSRIEAQSSRIEFVRNEIMFEMRYSNKTAASDITDAKILNGEKINKFKKEGCVILNMGCGHIPHDNMINIDARELGGVDVVADVVNISLPGILANEIYSSHVLEHFSQEQLIRQVLPNWISLLKEGGLIRAIVPDAETMISEYVANNLSFDDFRHVTFGTQEYEGDFHYNMFSWESLRKIFESVGLERVELIEKGRANGLCYEMELIAYKGSVHE